MVRFYAVQAPKVFRLQNGSDDIVVEFPPNVEGAPVEVEVTHEKAIKYLRKSSAYVEVAE